MYVLTSNEQMNTTSIFNLLLKTFTFLNQVWSISIQNMCILYNEMWLNKHNMYIANKHTQLNVYPLFYLFHLPGSISICLKKFSYM